MGNAALAGYTGVTRGSETLLAPVLSVCAGRGQLIAQQSRAVASSGELPRISARLQQSIMPLMVHSFSFECSGRPASALPPSVTTRTKDVSHFLIANYDYIEATSGLSRQVMEKRMNAAKV